MKLIQTILLCTLLTPIILFWLYRYGVGGATIRIKKFIKQIEEQAKKTGEYKKK